MAWERSCQFWANTGATIARHWGPLLLCAAVPAAARGYVWLRRGSLQHGRLALLDLLITVSRVLFCAVAVWAACTGNEWRQLSGRVGALAAWQVGLGMVGVNIAHRLRVFLWELLFFAAAFLLAGFLLRRIVLAASSHLARLQETQRRRALLSVVMNLFLVPTAVIYLVEIARPLFH